MTDLYTLAQLNAFKLQEETGMTLAELAALPLDEYARLTNRPTPAQAALAALDAQSEQAQPPAPAAPQSAPQPPAPESQGVDFRSMSMDEYAAVRGQLGVGVSHKEGRGIFDSVGSHSDAYTAAVRAQSGRTGWSQGNVTEPPRLEGRFVRQDDQRDYRSAAERFSTPGNSWQGQ
jgi:hypothetical protein